MASVSQAAGEVGGGAGGGGGGGGATGGGAAEGGGIGVAVCRAARSGRHGGQKYAPQALQAVWCWRKMRGRAQRAQAESVLVSARSARR